MLTEERIPGEIKLDLQGNAQVEYTVHIKRGDEIIHRYKEYVALDEAVELPEDKQALALPEVKARLAAAQGVIAKKEKPVPPKPKE